MCVCARACVCVGLNELRKQVCIARFWNSADVGRISERRIRKGIPRLMTAVIRLASRLRRLIKNDTLRSGGVVWVRYTSSGFHCHNHQAPIALLRVRCQRVCVDLLVVIMADRVVGVGRPRLHYSTTLIV